MWSLGHIDVKSQVKTNCCHLASITLFFSSFFAGFSVAQQQFFRVLPTDVHVGEGGIAVLHCSVGNRAGRVQWTKDGLTLGKAKLWLLTLQWV